MGQKKTKMDNFNLCVKCNTLFKQTMQQVYPKYCMGSLKKEDVVMLSNLSFKGKDDGCLVWVDKNIRVTYNLETQKIKCNCPDYKNNGKCYHADYVRDEMEWKPPTKQDTGGVLLNKSGLRFLLKKLIDDDRLSYDELEPCFFRTRAGRSAKGDDIKRWLEGDKSGTL